MIVLQHTKKIGFPLSIQPKGQIGNSFYDYAFYRYQ